VDRPSPEQVLSDLLGPNERLLWSGRPRQGVFLRSADAIAIPFSIFWTCGAVFWVIMASRSPDKAFLLFGIPFVGIGVYMLIVRFFVDSWQRANTTYGLTDQRVVIVSGPRRRSIKSLSLRTLSDVTLSEGKNGTGIITFGPTIPPWPYRGMQVPGMSTRMVPCFDQIANARSVFDQIRRVQS